MRCLHLFRMLNTTSGISCHRSIQTGAVMLGRTKRRNVPRKINYEPGLRHTEAALSENSDLLEEIENEEDLENCAEVMRFDDMDELDEKRQRERLGYIITAKKFFKAPREPSTLSCNERECIRYLHKADPVQWDVKTLSESFPATPDAIKKVLRGKFKFSEEVKKKMDLKVQKNWELLAEGKLQAAPEVLEHLNKFINRKEVLLDQIKKADFYLPEVKEEVTWNNGEMSNILLYYEKAIQKLAHKQEPQDVEMVSDGSQESASKIRMQRKISGGEKLEKSEKLTLNSEKSEKSENLTLNNEKSKKSENLTLNSEKSKKSENLTLNSEKSGKLTLSSEKSEKLEKFTLNNEKKEHDLPTSRTKFVFSNELGKVLCENNMKAEANALSLPNKKFEGKSCTEETENKKDFSDSERLRNEEQYYANQVKDIENTAFWNKGRTSKDKVLAENEKMPLGGPDSISRGQIWSSDVYPERIKIPRDKWRSGLTFRVKDCYYDDDGEFLYRVPGMVK